MSKIKSFFKKLNPMNAIEKFILKRLAKKIVNKLPKLKEKGVDFVEKEAKELLAKIEKTILNYIEKYKD